MNFITEIINIENILTNKTIQYLLSDIKNLNGIGVKTQKKIENLIKGNKIIDLLYHFPVSVIDRTYSPSLLNAETKRIITIKIKILKHIKPYNKSQPYKILCSDGTDYLTINIFGINHNVISSLFEIESERIISGKLEIWNDKFVMSNPDLVTTIDKKMDIPDFEPLYNLTSGISNRFIRRLIKQILNHINELIVLSPIPEWLDLNLIKQENFVGWIESISNIHNPKQNYIENNIYRKRIAYDEILVSQLLLRLIREKEQSINGIKMIGDNRYKDKLIKSLPFELTNSQKEVIKEINKDMALNKKMIRLIQGDVGSGKTIVALIAMINAIEAGYKCILMAPTEILAIQHFNKIQNILIKASLQKNIKLEILTGKDNQREKQKKLKTIEDNNIDIIIGTHALFQKNINISNIGLIVIDEQHRFGVNQRLMLTKKGYNADLISMTATPIPRTLAMTIWGDMDISIINELPVNRKSVNTKIISINQLDKLIFFIKNHILNNEKVYWVCPLIEESNKNKLITVDERFNYLKKIFEKKVSMIHGKMKHDEKDKIMQEFYKKDGDIKILVSTTVIEVGVDNPDATLMIIENAERFGLSALHQLRGRVGRGDKESTCILIHSSNISEKAKIRLSIIKNNKNGFEISEEDLKIRGAGEILGTDQSGFIKYKIANYSTDRNLFFMVRDYIKLILNNDKNLTSNKGKNLRFLLKIFEKNYNIDNLFSG